MKIADDEEFFLGQKDILQTPFGELPEGTPNGCWKQTSRGGILEKYFVK